MGRRSLYLTEATPLPFTEEELQVGALLAEAMTRAPAGCGSCGATGKLEAVDGSEVECPVCGGLGLVMIER